MIVAQKFEATAVQLVGAGLGLRAYHRRGRGAEFGVVIGRGDLGFRHGFERRIDHDPAEHGVVVVGSVQQVRDAREALPVHLQPVRSLRVFRLGCGKAYGPERHARGG